eukprot:scaffold150961_cov15-Tisochrysis_lutea.AAC.1
MDWQQGEGMPPQHLASANFGALYGSQDRSRGEGGGKGGDMCISGYEDADQRGTLNLGEVAETVVVQPPSDQRDMRQTLSLQKSQRLTSDQLPPAFSSPAREDMTQGQVTKQGEGEGLGGEDVMMQEGSSGGWAGPGSSTGGLSNGSNLSGQEGRQSGSGGPRMSGG